ncbi:N-acetyltransferase family protein [Streptomyces sp. HUAS TT7]|uniref:GNAT family N-acetyltransferase n=1 Tax=Streptomyces sp. HUAS TT7 TaxID=3447507 RepID=UPI003F65C813
MRRGGSRLCSYGGVMVQVRKGRSRRTLPSLPGVASGRRRCRRPVGWINFGPSRVQVPACVQARSMPCYVHPAVTRRGIGQALLSEAHAHMESQGFQAMVLWVLSDNHNARQFYERAGYRADGHTQDDVYDGVTLTELRYQRVVY